MDATGEDVYVWKDPWILNATKFRSHNKIIAFGNLNLKVFDLNDVDFHTWRMNKLNNLFFLDDVNAILTNPISAAGSRDKLFLHFIKLDSYKVKSNYHLAKNSND